MTALASSGKNGSMVDEASVLKSTVQESPLPVAVPTAEAETAVQLRVLLEKVLDVLRGCSDSDGTLSYDAFDYSRQHINSLVQTIGMFLDAVQELNANSKDPKISNVERIYQLLRSLPLDAHAIERVRNHDSLSGLLKTTLTGKRMQFSPLMQDASSKTPFALNQNLQIEKQRLLTTVPKIVQEIEAFLQTN